MKSLAKGARHEGQIKGRSRNNYRNAIVELFNCARKHGYLPNLRRWIEPFEGLTGRICEQWSTPQSVFQAWNRFATKRQIKAGANRFRNSYISYRVAQTSDPNKVALETGNSAAVIMED